MDMLEIVEEYVVRGLILAPHGLQPLFDQRVSSFEEALDELAIMADNCFDQPEIIRFWGKITCGERVYRSLKWVR